MPFDSESFEIDDAKSSSQDLYEVQFPDWGVRTTPVGQTAVNPNFQFPPPGAKAIPSLAGIAIGPRSTVDRCWVSWDRQKIVAATNNGSEPPKGMESRVRQLSVESPLMFTQASKIGSPLPSTMPTPPNINNSPVTAMHNGLLYIFPKEPYPDSVGTLNAGASSNAVMTQAEATTILPLKYVDQLGAQRPFLIPPAGILIKPYLELYLFLRPPLYAPPISRFPFFASFTQTVPAAYTPVGYIPIFGRRRVTVGLQNLTQVTDYRLGLIPCIRENDPTLLVSPPFEIPAGAALATPAGQAVGFQLSNPCSDYLVVYANPAGASDVSVQVAAYD